MIKETVETTCQRVAFRFTALTTWESEDCTLTSVQVGNSLGEATPAVCGYAMPWNDSHSDNYPQAFFEWTALASSDLTVSFKNGRNFNIHNQWAVEFRCVEDLLNSPTCANSRTRFGDVHYESTNGIQYLAIDSKNSLSAVVSEVNCPKVCMFRQ